MPRYTFPNQRVVRVHRERVTSDFLGIKNENWMAASRNLRPPALLLYLYLASNADNYETALSPAAVRQEIGMARSTYHDQFHILVDKGYLVPSRGNVFDFYEVPQPRAVIDSMNNESEDGLDFTADELPQVRRRYNVMGEDIEINNSLLQDTVTNNEFCFDEEEPDFSYRKEWGYGEETDNPLQYTPLDIKHGEFEF